MKRHQGLSVLAALGLAMLMAGCWGSSKSTSLDVGTAAEPAKVGSASCINTCHAVTPDHITGLRIADTWAAAQHTIDGGVQCEDCHGGGGNHFGVGPIPEPNPTTHCAACHGFATYTATAHYNGNNEPAGLFLQADAGTGQAVYLGQPEFRPDNVTPVTRAEHIEQCSRCHNPSQQFTYDADGTLIEPNPANLPQPRVGCGGCHDGHDPKSDVTIVQRTAPADYPRFRDYLVDAASGAQTDNAASGVRLSTINLIYQPNGSVALSGTPDYTRVVGNNNEIHPDRVCAVCHAKGTYLHSGAETHQDDVHGQWAESGHGTRTAAAFGEFSANPGFYNATFDNGHRVSYPYDMDLSSTGIPANTTRNAEGSFTCMKCHHGLGSVAYQDDVEGPPSRTPGIARVLFGDVTVTCITCHNPHGDVPGNTKNTRKPVVMIKYGPSSINPPAGGSLTFSGNVFLDNTAVPAETGNATICVFCHQGRESGFTLFRRRLTQDNAVGSFINEHYLGTGAMLWARNAYEYARNPADNTPNSYGQNTAHQRANCIGCHMFPAPAGKEHEIGGHTWRIFSEIDNTVNTAACNAADCHNGRVPADRAGLFAFRDTVLDPTADYDGDGSAEGMPQEIRDLSSHLINLLQDNGVVYDDLESPYFFKPGLPHTSANAFQDWVRPNLKAAFNVQFVIKGLPSSPVSQIGQPNPSAATHNHRYNIQILIDSYTDLFNNMTAAGFTNPNGRPLPSTFTRPAGTRAATNYLPQPGGGYHPNQ